MVCNPYNVYHGNHFITEALIEKDVIMFLRGIYTTEKGIRKVKNKCQLKLMPAGAELPDAVTFEVDSNFRHIFRFTSEKLWFSSGKHNLTFTNLRDDIIDQLNNI